MVISIHCNSQTWVYRPVFVLTQLTNHYLDETTYIRKWALYQTITFQIEDEDRWAQTVLDVVFAPAVGYMCATVFSLWNYCVSVDSAGIIYHVREVLHWPKIIRNVDRYLKDAINLLTCSERKTLFLGYWISLFAASPDKQVILWLKWL